ncbi:MAG: FAD-dependent oxidoreductase [Candidatus Dormiibacterota bacterium]
MDAWKPEVMVVGGGVVGLTTAIRLVERGRRVRIVTAEPAERTTSAAASAMWSLPPVAPDDPQLRWARASLPELQSLAATAGTGVHLARGVLASRVDGPLPPVMTTIPGFRPIAGGLPAGFREGFQVEVPLLDMPPYLRYLTARFGGGGGELQVRRLASLAEAAAEAPVIVNCAGVAARDLVPDPLVHPVFGQHVLVENPGLTDFFMEGPRVSEWVGIYPYDDHVVLGGVAVPDRWEREPDPSLAARIVDRCVEVEPRLRGARVLGHNAGLRPARPAVRLEVTDLAGARCVHNYGHGTLGVGLAWGCAAEAAELAAG